MGQRDGGKSLAPDFIGTAWISKQVSPAASTRACPTGIHRERNRTCAGNRNHSCHRRNGTRKCRSSVVINEDGANRELFLDHLAVDLRCGSLRSGDPAETKKCASDFGCIGQLRSFECPMNGFIKDSSCMFPGRSVFQVNRGAPSPHAEHPRRGIRQNALCRGLTAVDSEKESHVALSPIQGRKDARQCNLGVSLQQRLGRKLGALSMSSGSQSSRNPSYAKMAFPLPLHRLMRNQRARFYLTFLGALGLTAGVFQSSVSEAQRSEPPVRVWVEQSLTRVQPTTPPGSKKIVELAAARNEVESFQIIVSSTGPKLENIVAFVSDLSDGSNHLISNTHIKLYRQEYVYLRNPSPYAASNRSPKPPLNAALKPLPTPSPP